MLLRDALGETLRDARTRQNRTLRDVSTAANVSLGYLSEVERGRKEASSELLASICGALELELSDVLSTVSDAIRTDTFTEKVAANSLKASSSAAAWLDKSRDDKATIGGRHLSGTAQAGMGRGASTGSPAANLRIVLPYGRTEAPVR
ncbi:MAG: helix-turn-helix domain-containing protein [Actinomycetota bacterium]|nr:helix-turn-helix domain-containing protein [Actinomycetota bacterium]